MKKRKQGLFFCSLFILILASSVVCASGIITFQVEVVPGLTISSPELLDFSTVAPGQSSQRNLELIIWSNTGWELLVQARGDDVETRLNGAMEVQDDQGKWSELLTRVSTLYDAQPSTGPDGIKLNIPFRFTSSYGDDPGVYSFEVKFTLVPII